MVFADMREVAGSVRRTLIKRDTKAPPTPLLIRLQTHIQQVLTGKEGGGGKA